MAASRKLRLLTPRSPKYGVLFVKNSDHLRSSNSHLTQLYNDEDSDSSTAAKTGDALAAITGPLLPWRKKNFSK